MITGQTYITICALAMSTIIFKNLRGYYDKAVTKSHTAAPLMG